MEQIVEKITQDLLQKLPDQIQFFTPDELLSAGIPYIVVETLRKNVESTIKSELKMPETEWLKLNDEKVQMAWQKFVEVSRQHLQIPESKLSYLLTEAVEQCLELAVKPRQSVPEIIFRTRDTIDLKVAKERVGAFKVNKQLGLALLRYMEKKEKEEIGFEKASNLITKVDERLVEDYHPLKWAQALKAVFDIAGPDVDPRLFELYFEDKEKAVYASKFAKLEKPLNESEFIEALSSADLLDVDGYEEEQPELFVPVEEEAKPEKVVEIDDSPEEKKVISGEEEFSEDYGVEEEEVSTDETAEEEQEDESYFEAEKPEYFEESTHEETTNDEEKSSEQEIVEEDSEEEKKKDENIVDLFSKIREVDHVVKKDESRPVISLVQEEDDSDEKEDGDNITLLSKFMFDDSMDESLEEAEESESEPQDLLSQKEPTSIYDEMNLVQDDVSSRQNKQELFDEVEDDKEDENEGLSFKIEAAEEGEDEPDGDSRIEEKQMGEEPEDEENYIEIDEEEDQPMWRSFLERDDLETDSGYEYDEEDEQLDVNEADEEKLDGDGYIEEPIYDLTVDTHDQEEKISEISGWLEDEKDRFIDEIFSGSDFAYEQALADIVEFDNWKAASMYLESDIFSRNKIDVYDEVAVDFTDRLHSYFLENNSNHDG